MAVEFRYANLNEYQRVSDFIDQHWLKGHIYTRNRALFDWTFHRAGHWDADSYSVSLGLDGNELVGVLGGIPFTMNQFGAATKAIWIVNYVMREDYRKGATALQLLSSFRKPEFPAVVAFGVNPATSVIYRVLRGQVLPEIPRHFLVMPKQASRMARALRIAYPDWSEERSANLISSFELPKLPGKRRSRAERFLPTGIKKIGLNMPREPVERLATPTILTGDTALIRYSNTNS